MPQRVSRGRIIGHGRKGVTEGYSVRVPPSGTSGMVNAALIYGTMSSIQNIYPLSADTFTLGSTTKEWLALYIGDAGGIYFGLSQDIFLSRTAADKLGLAAGDTFQADTLETDTIYLDRTNLDVRLYRFGANKLGLDSGDTLCLATIEEVVGAAGIRCNSMFNIGPAYNTRIYAGSQKIEMGDRSANWDIELYRDGANVLRTNDLFKIIRPLVGDSGLGIAVSGDTEYRLIMLANGTITFGSGGAVQDTNLYRSAVNVLKTDDDFHIAAGKGLYTDIISEITGAAGVTIDSVLLKDSDVICDEIYLDIANQDIVLRRGGANLLQTPDNFEASTIQSVKGSTANNAFRVIISGEGNDRLTIRSDGTMRWSSGAAGWDTNLFRGGANQLKTQDQFYAVIGFLTGADIVSDAADTDSLGSTTKEWLNVYIGDAGKLYFGLGQDVNLYRSAANTLKTDDTLIVGAQLQIPTSGSGAGILIGGDILLYRDAANILRTPDTIRTDVRFLGIGSVGTQSLFSAAITGDSQDRCVIRADGSINLGSGSAAQDCKIYRSAANVLKTDDTLEVALGVYHSNVVTKTNADTPYTVAASDRVILCDTSGGVIELDLPAVAGVTGMILTIKKTTADATVVTLDGSGAEEIDGAVNNTEIDAQWDTLTIYCDGTQWLIISHKIA